MKSVNIEVEVSRATKEIPNIYNNLKLLESEEKTIWGAKTEQIRQLAKDYEILQQGGIYKEPVNNICATICVELRKMNLWASESLAHKVLDQKYKQSEFTPAHTGDNTSTIVPPLEPSQTDNNFISTTGTVTPDQSHYYYANASATDQMFPTYNNPNQEVQIDYLLSKPHNLTDRMTAEELRNHTEQLIDADKKAAETHRELRRRKKDFLEKCIKNKIPLSPQYENLTENQEHISTPHGEIGISEAWEALEDYKKTIEKVQDKLYYFKPPPKIAKMMARAVREEIEFWRPMTDEKFRKDMESWWVVEIDNLVHGKHAAAVMNATIIDEKIKKALINDPENKIDPSSVTPEIKELLVKEGIIKRNLTREQVGDKALEVMQRAIRFAEAQQMKRDFRMWYVNEIEPRIGERARELHRTLSDKSFT